jgi:hypothetical protein
MTKPRTPLLGLPKDMMLGMAVYESLLNMVGLDTVDPDVVESVNAWDTPYVTYHMLGMLVLVL